MKPWIVAALVAAGLGIGLIAPGLTGGAFPFVTLYVLLPALIFEAAWQLDVATMQQMWRPIVLLAVPGVIATAAIVAVAAHVLGALATPAALLLGAILSATDPVAVVAVFRRLKLPTPLATIVECESLFNDGVAVLIYRAMLVGGAAGYSVASIGGVAILAVLGAVMGVACGVAIGMAGAYLSREFGAPVRFAATVGAAYGAYAVAGALEWSGIFAVIACAIAMRTIFGRAQVDGEAEDRAWSRMATVANIALFVAIGAAVQLGSFARSWVLVAAALGAIVLARLVLAWVLRTVDPKLAGPWAIVIGLAGLRGALSLALALGLPADFVARQTIVDVTFGIVVVTLVIGGLSERIIRSAAGGVERAPVA
jgi:CPA1 family monovalent cation:H+ antiporter